MCPERCRAWLAAPAAFIALLSQRAYGIERDEHAKVRVAAQKASSSYPTPFDGLAGNVVAAFSGTNLIFHGAAVAATGVVAWSGADHAVRVWTQEHERAPAIGDVAYYSGYALPVLLPLGVYVTGHLSDSTGWVGAGSAAAQAVLITVTSTVVLKVVTGRPFPRHGDDPDAPDQLDHPERAREFSPMHFDGYYAWPSGHTATAMALAASLTAYSPDEIAVPLIAYPIALGIGGGMILGDHHWTSDVLAGALLGQAVGRCVGKAFHERRSSAAGASESIHVLPLLGSKIGAVVSARW